MLQERRNLQMRELPHARHALVLENSGSLGDFMSDGAEGSLSTTIPNDYYDSIGFSNTNFIPQDDTASEQQDEIDTTSKHLNEIDTTFELQDEIDTSDKKETSSSCEPLKLEVDLENLNP